MSAAGHRKKKRSCWSRLCNCWIKNDNTRYLYAFDFDHTIINENSDTAIAEVVPHPIPEHIKNIFDGNNWTEFMDHVFRYIASEGATIAVLAEKIKKLELTPGMEHVLHKISAVIKKKSESRLIIISDANDFFINTSLSNLRPPVVPSQILSNHATFPWDKSYLKIYPFEEQTFCPICPKNMCKGNALRKYIIENGPYDQVYYTGDGGNDLCPAQQLRENDILFVRQNYALSKIISRGYHTDGPIKIVAKIIYFEGGKTIEDNIQY